VAVVAAATVVVVEVAAAVATVVVVVVAAAVVAVVVVVVDTVHFTVACFDCISSMEVGKHEYSFDALSWHHFSKMSLSNQDNGLYTC
jgi:hypothetical protein